MFPYSSFTVIVCLATVSLFASLTASAPTTSAASRKQRSAVSPRVREEGRGRRVKRNAIAIPNQDIEEELANLSDSELELLAGIVQAELDKYDPESPAEVYEIIEIPDDFFPSDEYSEEIVRNRRSVPIEQFDDDVLEETPELVLIPQEMTEEEEKEENELRDRIAEMASILNERASRKTR